MATTFKLKRKLFFLANDGSAFTLADAQKATGSKGVDAVIQNQKLQAQTNATNAANRAAERAANKANASGVKNAAMKARTAGYNAGVKQGAASVGIKQGAMNTWKGMGKLGKAGAIAGGIAGAGLMAKGLFGNKKD